MELNKLYYFYIVAKHEHVTRAAEELCVSQPALTKTIKQLEDEVGVPLFQKKSRNVELTVYGKYLKNKLSGVFQALGEIPEEIKMLKGETNNTIRMNVLSASTVVTEAIVNYKRIKPEAVFQVIQNEEETDCDISVLTSSEEFIKKSEFEKCCNIPEEIYLAVPKAWKCDERGIELSDFKDRSFVNLAGSRVFRVVCDGFCLLAGFKPKIVFESDSIIAVKNIIGVGAGVGFWPAFSWGKVSEDIALLPIKSPSCKREIVLGLHKNLLSDTARDFFEYLIKFMEMKKDGEN